MKNSKRAREQIVQVFGRLSKEVAKVLLPNDSDWLLEQNFLKTGKENGDGAQKIRQVTKSIADDVVRLVNTMPRHSMGYRISRALLTCNASDEDLYTTFEELNPPTFGRKARKQGQEDMTQAQQEGLDPEKRRRTLRRLSNDNILRIVKHVLSFIQTLSWGTKDLKQNGKKETILFPKLTKTHAVETMFTDYARKEAELKCIDFDTSVQPPQRTVYFEIAKALTSKAEKSISCIDYVMDILVNDPVKTITRIIEELVAPRMKPIIKEHLRVVQHFLKYQYDSHLSRDSSAVSQDEVSLSVVCLAHSNECSSCTEPFARYQSCPRTETSKSR